MLTERKPGTLRTGSQRGFTLIEVMVALALTSIITLVIIYAGIEIFQPDPGQTLHIPIRMVRYAVGGFWVSGGAPWLFTKIRLA